MLLATSFAELKKFGACPSRYRHLAKALGGVTKYGRNTPIPLRKILEINGWSDVDWLLGWATESFYHDLPLANAIAALASGFLKRKRADRQYPILDQLYYYCDSKRKLKAFLDYAEVQEEKVAA